MKKIILSACLLVSSSLLLAQDNSTCYQKYVKVFEVRGANEISDGLHENVIITIRKGSFADCFVGRAKVKDGLIDTKTLQMSFVDDTYEAFRRAYKYDEPVNIVNGISKTLVTKDEELVKSVDRIR